MKKTRIIKKAATNTGMYLVLFITLILSSFFIAAVLVSSLNRKAMKTNILKVESRLAGYKEDKMKLVDKCNKLENKLGRATSENKIAKYNKKLEINNKKILNINLVLNDKTVEEIDTPTNKLVEKFDGKINEIKENLNIV